MRHEGIMQMTSPSDVPRTDTVGAQERSSSGAVLLDVREPDVRRAGHIDGMPGTIA